jgi:hypothetical protein
MRTPLRDELGLNDPDAQLSAAEGSRRELRNREAMEKNIIRSGLAGLPAPKNEYQIVVPEVGTRWIYLVVVSLYGQRWWCLYMDGLACWLCVT